MYLFRALELHKAIQGTLGQMDEQATDHGAGPAYPTPAAHLDPVPAGKLLVDHIEGGCHGCRAVRNRHITQAEGQMPGTPVGGFSKQFFVRLHLVQGTWGPPYRFIVPTHLLRFSG